MHSDDNEEKLLRSVALQNAQAVLLARERAERALIAANEELERKSTELAEQREFFRVTLASIGDAVITTDIEARITYLNAVAETMTGWTLGDAVGQPLEKVFTIIDEQSRKPAHTPMEKLLRDGLMAEIANHTALISRDDTETPIDVSAAPIRDASGHIVGAVVVFHDVTRQRRAETALRESNQSLSEARDHLERRVEERSSELNAANESLRGLSASLLQMRDEEQRRLARELHDSVGQLVAAIGININVVSGEAHKLSPAAAKCVFDNARLLQDVSREIRTISHLLHPPLLDEAGLESALRWYVEGFAERSKINVDLQIPGDFGRLPHDAEIAIFRVIQECLTNIHRHSGSATASISLWRTGGRLVVEVQDSGKGISEEQQRDLTSSGRTGVGFRGMRERLRQLQGTLEIRSEGRGTVVRAILNVAG